MKWNGSIFSKTLYPITNILFIHKILLTHNSHEVEVLRTVCDDFTNLSPDYFIQSLKGIAWNVLSNMITILSILWNILFMAITWYPTRAQNSVQSPLARSLSGRWQTRSGSNILKQVFRKLMLEGYFSIIIISIQVFFMGSSKRLCKYFNLKFLKITVLFCFWYWTRGEGPVKKYLC